MALNENLSIAINENTPLAALTVGQFRELFPALPTDDSKEPEPEHGKKYAHGLWGIRQVFGVSHATAQRYKDTFLKPSIKQNGRKIMMDVEHAIELFNQRNKKV